MNLFQRIFKHLDELHDYRPEPTHVLFTPRFDRSVAPDGVSIDPALNTMETPLTSINAEIHTTRPTDETDRLIAEAIRAAGVYDTTKETPTINSAIVEASSPSVPEETMDSVNTAQGVETTSTGVNALQMGRILLELDLTPEQSMQLFTATLAAKQSIMTLEEVATQLRLETFEVAQLTRQGKLTGFVAGANLRYRRLDVDTFIETQLQAMRNETTQENHAA